MLQVSEIYCLVLTKNSLTQDETTVKCSLYCLKIEVDSSLEVGNQ